MEDHTPCQACFIVLLFSGRQNSHDLGSLPTATAIAIDAQSQLIFGLDGCCGLRHDADPLQEVHSFCFVRAQFRAIR